MMKKLIVASFCQPHNFLSLILSPKGLGIRMRMRMQLRIIEDASSRRSGAGVESETIARTSDTVRAYLTDSVVWGYRRS